MWTKPTIASLLIYIARGAAAANVFNEVEEHGVVHRVRPHLFDAPAPSGEDNVLSPQLELEIEGESERYTCRSIIAIAYSHRPLGGKKKQRGVHEQGQRRRIKSTHRRKKHAIDDNSYDPNDEGEEEHQEEGFVCEVEDGYEVPIEATYEQLQEMRAALSNGTLISAVSTMEVVMIDVAEEDEQVGGGASEYPPPKSSNSKSAKLPAGPIHLSSNTRRLSEHPQRRLHRLLGGKKLLVIRVTDADGKAPIYNAAYYSNKIFGTSGDAETPKTQLYGCSHGAMDLTYDFGEDLNKKMTAKGVLDVKINVSLKKVSTVTAWLEAKSVAEKILGCSLPSGCRVDHVAFLLEDCYKGPPTCGWAAYAYINSYASVFIRNYAAMPAVFTHELGHNLNMAHSGRGSAQYLDHSCSMGNPHWEDHLDKQCFNPAKNFFIASTGAWYDKKYVTVLDPVKSPYWTGRFVGVAEYDRIRDEDIVVVLKLETGSNEDYFIGFNRKTGQNSHNLLASDKVTIIKAGANGEGYAQSWFQAGLAEKERYSWGTWGKTNEALVIEIVKIDKTRTPGYADVRIVLGNAAVPVTSSPTPVPTTSISPTTSVGPSRAPVIPPSMMPSVTSSHAPSVHPTGSPSRPPGKSPTKKYIASKNKQVKMNTKFMMFRMEATLTAEVVIEKIAIKTKDVKNIQVNIYYQAGSYDTFPSQGMSQVGWQLVYSGIPGSTLSGMKEAVLDNPIKVTPGQFASFYIERLKGIMYAAGTNEFGESDEGEDFTIYTGASLKKPFLLKVGPADFAGELTYYTVAT